MHEAGHCLGLKCIICQRETTAKRQWPVNWKRDHFGAIRYSHAVKPTRFDTSFYTYCIYG